MNPCFSAIIGIGLHVILGLDLLTINILRKGMNPLFPIFMKRDLRCISDEAVDVHLSLIPVLKA